MRRATPDHSPDAVARRSFLRRGAVVGGAAALGAGLHATGAAAQVSAQAAQPVYVPIPPTRVYDSRGESGPLGRGETRTLAPPTPPDPFPYALTINLTITETAGKGWLAAYPGDVPFGGTSSINWFGDLQDLANNAFVGVGAGDASINFSAGGTEGSHAQFIVDVIGASIDATALSGASTAQAARDALAALRASWTER